MRSTQHWKESYQKAQHWKQRDTPDRYGFIQIPQHNTRQTVSMRCRMSRNDKNVELAWGGSLGNPGHSVDGCMHSALPRLLGGSTARTRKTFGWWGAIGELIAMQQLMHVSSALQQNCHSRALSQSGAERGGWTTKKERDRKREGGTKGGGNQRERETDQYWDRK